MLAWATGLVDLVVLTWKSWNQAGWELFLVETLRVGCGAEITGSGGYSVWSKDDEDVEKSEVEGSWKMKESWISSVFRSRRCRR